MTGSVTAAGDEFASGTTWRPDQGEHPTTIAGKLIEVRTVEGGYGPYPLVELEEDGGVVWEFHAFRDVAKSELASCAPQPGERISIAYGGRSEKGYFRYRVRKVDGSNRVDWSRFGDEPSPVEPDVPADAGDLPAPPPRRAAEEPDEGDDTDVPF